jgi:hypothetical protein
LPEQATRHDAWSEALARLEASTGSVLDADQPAPWAPPTGLGAMPKDLSDRAEGLLAALRTAIAELAAAQRTTARHLVALRTVPTREDHQPVYLDVSG